VHSPEAGAVVAPALAIIRHLVALLAATVAARRKPYRFSSDRLYLNVCIGLRIAGERTLPRNVRVTGVHRGA